MITNSSLRWINLALLAILCLSFRTVVAADDPKDHPAAEAESKHWTVDFEEAKAAAAEQGKSILMEFTGSDWCPPCIALHKNVLSTELFLTEAPKHFILLKLDSPRDKSKQSEKEIAQYKELSALYQVSGVPSIILVDSQGKPYAKKVGYGGQEADVYLGELVTQLETLAKRDAFLAKAEGATGVDKARLLDEAIRLIDPELAATTYKETVDEIIALDADDSAGLKSKYEGVLLSAKIKGELKEIRGLAREPEKAIARVDELIANLKPTGDDLQLALYYKAMFTYNEDKPAAKELLEQARKAAPESELTGNIDRILKSLSITESKTDPEKPDTE